MEEGDPSQALVAGLFQIHTALASFQRLVNTLGTPKDTFQLRQTLHKSRVRIGELVKDASAKLKLASQTDLHSQVTASKKIADAKLAKDFQLVLREFQKAQRLAAERETTYAPLVPKEEVLLYSEQRDEEPTKNSEQTSLLVESKRQEVIQLENEIVFYDAIIEEREQGIKEIQQQIGEVNDIFKDLAVLVHEQGVVIDDISSNIESSHARTTEASSQLAKASKTQRSTSSMTCLLLVIFGIILIIVIIIVVA